MITFFKPTNGFSRVKDNYGSGQFNASRDGGKRSHQGLDITAKPGEIIKSPIDGNLIREANPYKNDPRFKGVVIKGTGEFQSLEVKIFYVADLKCGFTKAGEIIGTAQDLSIRYKGITNNIHIEVRRNNIVVSPAEFFNYSF